MVSVAKQTGDGKSVWPAGADSMAASTDEFLSVYSHTLNILGWYENVPSEDIPPTWMWHLDWELEKHWKIVRSKRDSGTNSNEPEYNEESENLLFDDWAAELRKP